MIETTRPSPYAEAVACEVDEQRGLGSAVGGAFMSGEIGERIVPGPPDDLAGEDPEGAILRKVARRLIPFLFVLYVANILDRANVSFARLPDAG